MWGAIPASQGVCFDLSGLWVSLVARDVSSDVWILAMPIPMVWKLNLKRRDTVMLTRVFLLGAVYVAKSLHFRHSLILAGVELTEVQSNRLQHHELLSCGGESTG